MYVATSWRESVATARTLEIGEMMPEVGRCWQHSGAMGIQRGGISPCETRG